MSIVKVRYNTKATENDPLKWRVLVDGLEFLADDVIMQGFTRTSTDLLPEGIVKHHISIEGTVTWIGCSAYVTSAKPEFSVKSTPRGVQFYIGNQGFTLANTEMSDDPESQGTQEFFERMLNMALGSLAG